MPKKINLIGKKFNRLLVLKMGIKNKFKKYEWLCKCDCGNEKSIVGSKIKRGEIKSCGCLLKENQGTPNYRHGMSDTRFDIIFRSLKNRCKNPNATKYKYYGGKGIRCEWKSFEEYRDDMYDSYLEHCKIFGERQTTIDRIDSNKNYCKENCRWATYHEQRINRCKKRDLN